MSMHDGVNSLWILRRATGLNIDGFKNEVAAIDSLIRHLMVRDDSDASKAAVRAVVENAIKHMDEPTDDEHSHDCDNDDCQRCHHVGALASKTTP